MNLFKDIDLTSGNIIPMNGNLPVFEKAPLKKYDDTFEEKIKSLIQDTENAVLFYKWNNNLEKISLKNRDKLKFFYERVFKNIFIPEKININNTLPYRDKISFALKEEGSIIIKANEILDELKSDDREVFDSFIYNQIGKISILTGISLDIK